MRRALAGQASRVPASLVEAPRSTLLSPSVLLKRKPLRRHDDWRNSKRNTLRSSRYARRFVPRFRKPWSA